MAYMLLIHEPRGQRAERGREQGEAVYQRMLDFGAELHARGKLIASDSLQPDSRAVRVQKRDGKTALLDGPFAEAREMIGGFYLLNCESFDEAVQIGQQCPAAEWCTVEVRQTGPCYSE